MKILIGFLSIIALLEFAGCAAVSRKPACASDPAYSACKQPQAVSDPLPFWDPR